jgi:hypothetical protein
MTEEVGMIGTVTEEMVIIGLLDHLMTQGTKDIIITDTTGIEEEIGMIGETHCSRINRDTMIDNKREDKEFPHKTLNLS